MGGIVARSATGGKVLELRCLAIDGIVVAEAEKEHVVACCVPVDPAVEGVVLVGCRLRVEVIVDVAIGARRRGKCIEVVHGSRVQAAIWNDVRAAGIELRRRRTCCTGGASRGIENESRAGLAGIWVACRWVRTGIASRILRLESVPAGICRGEQLGEVPSTHQRGGNSQVMCGHTKNLAQRLVVAEREELVLEDRPAQRKAGLVAEEARGRGERERR